MNPKATPTNGGEPGRTGPGSDWFFVVFDAERGTLQEMREAAIVRTSEHGSPTGLVDLTAHQLDAGPVVIALVEYVPHRRRSDAIAEPGAWLPIVRRWS